MAKHHLPSEDFLEKVLESLTHPFYVIDANDYTIKLANSASGFGELSEDCTCFALTHRRNNPCGGDHPCPLEEVKKTKQPVVVEHTHYDKDGVPRIVEVHGYPILDKDGNVTEMIEYCLDITDRKHAEEAMRVSQEMLQLVINNIPQHIFWKDRNSVYLGCNRNFAEDAGIRDPANIVGKTDYDLPWKQEEADFFRDYDRRVMDADEPILHIIEPQLQADGKEAWLDTSKIPLHDADGNVVGILGTYEDITERVRYADRQKELLEREQHITAVLQQAIVPPVVPSGLGDYKIAVRYQPALREAEVGGDFYDVFDLGSGKIGILLGDVVGKGLSAAIQVSAARYTIRAYAQLDPSPGKVLELTNKSLFNGKAEDGGELTVFFAVLDTAENIITYANAGQEPPILMHSDGSIEQFDPTGMLINVFDGFGCGEKSRVFDPGDKIIMVTDGITEARSENSIFFDSDGVISYMKQNASKSPQELADGLLAAAMEHAGGGLQDDAAIVVIEHAHES